MLGAKPVALPILPWTFSLIASLAVAASEQTPMPENNPVKAVAVEAGDTAKQMPSPAPRATEKIPVEKASAKPQTTEVQMPAKAPGHGKNPQQERTVSAEKPQSILQMLEGHETELAIAAAIAVGAFFIGWISGGNY